MIKTYEASFNKKCLSAKQINQGLYKSAVFVIQAICFKETGEYYSRKAELVKVVKDNDKSILKVFSNIKKGKEIDFQRMSEMLFSWSKYLIQ